MFLEKIFDPCPIISIKPYRPYVIVSSRERGLYIDYIVGSLLVFSVYKGVKTASGTLGNGDGWGIQYHIELLHVLFIPIYKKKAVLSLILVYGMGLHFNKAEIQLIINTIGLTLIL